MEYRYYSDIAKFVTAEANPSVELPDFLESKLEESDSESPTIGGDTGEYFSGSQDWKIELSSEEARAIVGSFASLEPDEFLPEFGIKSLDDILNVPMEQILEAIKYAISESDVNFKTMISSDGTLDKPLNVDYTLENGKIVIYLSVEIPYKR